MNYKPLPEWNEAVERANKERKEHAQEVLRKSKLKEEKQKLERQKGKRK